jgi:hypothetical protein
MMIAALTHASKCFGIEMMKNPAGYAVELLKRFENRAQASLAPIELVHGDFLNNDAVKEAMKDAGLVFMNNVKFGPELDLSVLSE